MDNFGIIFRFIRSSNKILCAAHGWGGAGAGLRRMSTGWPSPRRVMPHHSARKIRWKVKLLKMLSGFRQQYCMWRLHRLLGVGFDECGFQMGTRQAAATMIEAVRRADWPCIRSCCTERGSADIYGLSREPSPYSTLVRFQSQHLRHALPLRVVRSWIDGRCYVLVDMLFVGLRNLLDFSTVEEQQEMRQKVHDVLSKAEALDLLDPCGSRLVIVELVLTFCRELKSKDREHEDRWMEPDSINNRDNPEAGWLVDAYKMHAFKFVTFSPGTFKIRVIDFRKPV